jgi:hypothetical protein
MADELVSMPPRLDRFLPSVVGPLSDGVAVKGAANEAIDAAGHKPGGPPGTCRRPLTHTRTEL